jgi:lysophospholipase
MDVVDHLIESPDAPVPPGARVGILAAADGVRIRWATFEAFRPRGTVILLQGRAEYIECWFETIRDLQARGLSVVTFDWRGQGGSQRLARHPRKGHVTDMASYDFDLDAVLRLVAPNHPKPWYVLAHSTGGLVAAANGARLARDVRRMVLTAPFLGLGSVGPAEPVTRVLAKTLRALGMGTDWVPGGGATPIHTTPFEQNVLTSDPVRHARGAEMSWRHPEIAVGSPTVGWLAAAFEVMDRVLAPTALAAWRLPTLIFACGDDQVVSNRAIETFATRTVATEHLVIPGARHELLKERDRFREQFWAGFDAFVPGSDAPPVEMPRTAEPPPPPADLVEPTAPADAPTDDIVTETDAPAASPADALTAVAALAATAAAASAAGAETGEPRAPKAAEASASTTPEVIALPPPAAETAPTAETEPTADTAPTQASEADVAVQANETKEAEPVATDAAAPAVSEMSPPPAVAEPASSPDEPTAAIETEAPAPAEPAGSAETETTPASALVGEEGEHLVVQPAVAGGDDAAAVDGAAAVPGGDDTAGTLDHRDQGDDVVGLQPGLDDHVDEAGRDHAVGVAVDPVARQPDP